MKLIKTIPLFFFLFALHLQLSGQTNFWTRSEKKKTAKADIQTKASAHYNLDIKNLRQFLTSKLYSKGDLSLAIPMPNGSFETFWVEPSKVMSSKLAARYPEILTFSGHNSKGMNARFDLTVKGFHAMIFSLDGTVFIDPVNQTSKGSYQCYYKKDYIQKEVRFLEEDVFKTKKTKTKLNKSTRARSSGTQLREYRLAVTTTGEYTAFHGGTVAAALSAIATTMNRINGIYEREVAIRMVLIANNDQLIYTDATTDPYTNGDAFNFIDQVQDNIDMVIGNHNYDLSHGFFQPEELDGLASLAGVCSAGRKAGVSGFPRPIGDPFDVDFVAHELGHQFGAEHTFNGSTCASVNPPTAYEPGSGTTILAYAGICGSQNIQNNSDPYFHTASYEEILTYSVGNSCPTISATGNHPPSVDAGEGNFTIPVSTPFTLTGSGVDPDGEDLTFSWEQFDLGPKDAPDNPRGNAPIFRSFPPKSIPSRTFPDIADIISNSQTIGELLPTYSRDLTFRLTARDNNNGGGGVNYDQMSFEVTDQAGPFLVSSFNTSATIKALDNVTINWDIANTNGREVNCQSVNILLSKDGGMTFPYTLASSVANSGSATILIPDVATSAARFKVEAADNVFFDINDVDITIVAPTSPDFNLSLSSPELTICAPETGQLDVIVGSVLNFSEDVTLSVNDLPEGLTATFAENSIVAGGTTSLTFSGTNLKTDAMYDLRITATSGAKSKSFLLKLTIFDEIIDVIEILNPVASETDVTLTPTIIWNEPEVGYNYSLEIATDDTFTNVIASVNDVVHHVFTPNILRENTTYFLRIKGINGCGASTDFSVIEFTTLTLPCSSSTSTDVPISISASGTPTITSTIEVSESGFIHDLNVLNLVGTHAYITDLTFRLESPTGTSVMLIDRICNGEENFNINLDDEAGSGNYPCPPTDAGTYQPEGSLSDFVSESITGTWTLTIDDNEDADGGRLTGWSLEMCLTERSLKPNPPSNLIATSSDNFSTDLIWDDNSVDEMGFSIERSIGDNTSFTEIARVPGNINHFNDPIISDELNYFYRIVALGNTINSNFSNEVSISFTLPEPPSNLTLIATSTTQINLSWDDNSTNEGSFIVERSRGDNANYNELVTLPAETNSYEDDDVAIPNVYFYRLKAANGLGISEYSNEASESLVLGTAPGDHRLIEIYPNPSSGLFNLILPGKNLKSVMAVYDLVGNRINATITNENGMVSINLTNYSNGFYFLNIQNASSNHIIRLIKKKN